VDALAGICRDCGVPASLAEVGVSEADLPRLAEDAMKQTRLLVNNPREVTYRDAYAIYSEALDGKNGRRPEQGPRPSRRSPRGWSSMNPFDAMQNLADLWNKGGQAYLTAQQGLFTGMADTMAKAAGRGDKASFQAFAPDTQGFEAARQDFAKLWSSASELSAALTRTLKADQANPQVAAMLAKIVDPRGWLGATNEVDQTLQRMAEGPQLADLWNTERKFIAVFNAWTAMHRHSLEHNKVMLEAWMKAAGAFAKS
jgi:hypothetical protein